MATSKPSDLVTVVREHLAEANPDVLRSLIEEFAHAPLCRQADAICARLLARGLR